MPNMLQSKNSILYRKTPTKLTYFQYFILEWIFASQVGGMLAGFLQTIPEENKNEMDQYYVCFWNTEEDHEHPFFALWQSG